jgi:hypothetical protein
MKPNNSLMKKRSPKIRKLRGKALVEAAVHALANLGSWEGELTWKKMEARFGVTRQAMSDHDEIADAFDATKEALKKNQNSVKAIVRRDAEERIKALKNENARLNKVIDGFIEKWLMMEVNCLALKVDPRAILGDRPEASQHPPEMKPGI